MLRCILLSLFLFLSFSAFTQVEIIYANSQTNSITGGFCIGCSITNAANAVDESTTTYASMTTFVGAGVTLRINMSFPEEGTAADIIGIGLGNPVGIIDVAALSSVSFIVKNNGTTVATYTSAGLLAINVLVPNLYAVYMAPGVTFDEVDVRLNYTAGALAQLNVYYASFSKHILDIAVSSIDAYADNGSVSLSWVTQNELGIDQFVIEHSNNQSDFKEIGTLNAKGNGTQQQFYSFIDAMPAQGENYYRLRQINSDGTEDISQIVHAYVQPADIPGELITAVSGDNEIIIYGNFIQTEHDIFIYNSVGQVISNHHLHSENGRIILNRNWMTEGIYFISVVDNLYVKSCAVKL